MYKSHDLHQPNSNKGGDVIDRMSGTKYSIVTFGHSKSTKYIVIKQKHVRLA